MEDKYVCVLFQAEQTKQTEMQIRVELEHMQGRYSELQSQYMSLLADNSENLSAHQQLKTENDEKQAKITMLSADLTTAQEVKETLEGKLSDLHQTLESQQKQMQDEVQYCMYALFLTCNCNFFFSE